VDEQDGGEDDRQDDGGDQRRGGGDEAGAGEHADRDRGDQRDPIRVGVSRHRTP
jgi:hypothetical protein